MFHRCDLPSRLFWDPFRAPPLQRGMVAPELELKGLCFRLSVSTCACGFCVLLRCQMLVGRSECFHSTTYWWLKASCQPRCMLGYQWDRLPYLTQAEMSVPRQVPAQVRSLLVAGCGTAGSCSGNAADHLTWWRIDRVKCCDATAPFKLWWDTATILHLTANRSWNACDEVPLWIFLVSLWMV